MAVSSRVLVSVLMLAGCAMLVSWTMRPASSAGPCLVVNGPSRLPEIDEASGLAVSRRHPGVLWSHNDSGNAATLFAIDRDGTPRGSVRVPAGMRDWEDIAAARCPAGDCLYLGDIGDNRRVRHEIVIYRVPEPALNDTETAMPERFRATYADGPHNAESMVILGSDLFIVTRDRTAAVYRATIPENEGDMLLQQVGDLGLSVASDAEAAPDGRSVAVRNSQEALFYRAADFVDGRFTPYFRLRIDGLQEPQGEGIAVDGNMLFLASEGRSWTIGGGRLIGLRCADDAIAP
jgi:hypothetical protein